MVLGIKSRRSNLWQRFDDDRRTACSAPGEVQIDLQASLSDSNQKTGDGVKGKRVLSISKPAVLSFIRRRALQQPTNISSFTALRLQE